MLFFFLGKHLGNTNSKKKTKDCAKRPSSNYVFGFKHRIKIECKIRAPQQQQAAEAAAAVATTNDNCSDQTKCKTF